MSSAGPTRASHELPSNPNIDVNTGHSNGGIAIQVDDENEPPEILEEDFFHKHCTHPTLPKETTIVIDIDLLQGNTAPSISALANSSEPQEPNTARIYLCHTCDDARDIFQRLGMTASQRYVETMVEHGDKHPSLLSPDKARAYQLDERVLSLPYDPRRLFEWIRIEPGGTAFYWLPTFHIPCLNPPDPSLEVIIQHNICISRGLDDMYSVVWFDFGRLYSIYGHSSVSISYSESITAATTTTCDLRRRFAYLFYHSSKLHCMKSQRVSSFPVLLMLDLLRLDLNTCHDRMVLAKRLAPVRHLFTSRFITGAILVTDSLKNFPVSRNVLDKLEGVETYASCLRRASLPANLNTPLGPTLDVALEELGIAASFLLSQMQRHLKDGEELRALHTCMVQGRQASSMSALTYCAALFIPLSLAASFVSMQNRVRDIGMMVYDFLGVGSIFITVAVIVFLAQKNLSKYMLWTWKRTQYFPSRLRRKIQRKHHIVRIFYGVGWLILVATFVFGMFLQSRDVPYASAAVFAFLFVPPTVVFMLKGLEEIATLT